MTKHPCLNPSHFLLSASVMFSCKSTTLRVLWSWSHRAEEFSLEWNLQGHLVQPQGLDEMAIKNAALEKGRKKCPTLEDKT